MVWQWRVHIDNNDNVSVLLEIHHHLIRLTNPLKTTITMNTILEIARSFLKILLNQTVDKTMVAAIKENESARIFSQERGDNTQAITKSLNQLYILFYIPELFLNYCTSPIFIWIYPVLLALQLLNFFTRQKRNYCLAKFSLSSLRLYIITSPLTQISLSCFEKAKNKKKDIIARFIHYSYFFA